MKFLVIDAGGIHVDTARRLGLEGNDVYYFCPWNSTYPKFVDAAPGYGVKEITKVLDWAPYVDDADCVVLPDSGMGALGYWLRQKGLNVFSAGLGERLEYDRAFSFEAMAKVGIKVPPTWTVKGVDQAIEKLTQLFSEKGETNQIVSGRYYVKFDIWRGTQETFPAESVKAATMRLNEVRSRFGPYASQVPITIQGSVEGTECGGDCFFNGKEWLTPGMWGFESGGSYIGYVTEDMTIFQEDLDRLTPMLTEMGFRGAFSWECLYDGKTCWWIDPTPRFPMPLGLMYSVFSTDFGALIHGVASGDLAKSNLPANRYLGAMEFSSEEAAANWSAISGGERCRYWRYMMDEAGQAYTVPGGSCVGIACGEGDNLSEVEAACQKEGETFKVFFGSATTSFAQDIKDKYVDPLKKLGVEFGHSPKLERRNLASPRTRATRLLEGIS